MNKKGGHIDWVISMGIFIVYIFALFILLRPGIKPIYRPVTLLNNLQEQFEDDVVWTIKMVPLFIRKCSGGSVTDGYSSVWVEDKHEPRNWRVCGSCVKDANGKSPPTKLECGNSEFKSEYTGPFYYYFNGEGVFEFDYDYSCMSVTPEEDCKFEIGIAENIEGINPSWLGDITSDDIEDYKSLKESWNVPEDKDFAILEDGDKVIGVEPYEMANVFVRRVDYQNVRRDGSTEPTIIYFKIW